MKNTALVLIALCLSIATTAQTVPSYVPTNGLVGWWPFNGNANDESGNGNNGTVNGALLATDRFGNLNSCFEFISNSYISVLDNPTLRLANTDFTITAWINLADTTPQAVNYGGYAIATKRDFSNNTYDYNFMVSAPSNTVSFGAGYLTCSTSNLSGNYIVSVSPLNLNTWVMVSTIYKVLNGELSLFVNGTLINTVTGVNSPSSQVTDDLWFGNDVAGSPYYFHGNIDDIGMWNRALTQQEISDLYQSNNCSLPSYIPTNGLIGYWPFCGNANDVSGNGNNGIVNGATLIADKDGVSNNAYDFDGSGQYIEVPDNSSFDFSSNKMTVSFWAKVESFPSGSFNDVMISQQSGSGATQSGFNVYQGGSSFIGMLVSDGGGNLNGISVPSDPSNYNQFHHVVLVINEDTLTSYIDGQLHQSIVSTTPTAIGANTLPLLFGKANWNNINASPFDGVLDDIGIWNRALTAQEITTIYNSSTCTKPGYVSLGTDRSTIMCPNDSVKIFVVSPSDPGLTYQWYRNNTVITGATNSYYYAGDGSKYKVRVSSGPGTNCQRLSGLIEPIITTAPPVTITAQGPTAICQGDSVLLTATVVPGYTYQWKRMGVNIAGATSPNFYAKQAGNYKVQISNSGGCTSISPLVSVTIVCRQAGSTEPAQDIMVFPNPSSGNFSLEFQDIGTEQPKTVELRDINGKLIEQWSLHSITHQSFNPGILSPGNYFVKVIFESGDSVEKQLNIIR